MSQRKGFDRNKEKFMSNYLGKLQQLLCLLTCVLMVVAVSIRRDGKVAGWNVKNQQTVSQKQIQWLCLMMVLRY